MGSVTYRDWDEVDLDDYDDRKEFIDGSWQVALIGAAIEDRATTMQGQRSGPLQLRARLRADGPVHFKTGVRIDQVSCCDLGDYTDEAMLAATVFACREHDVLPIVVGGDDSIVVPVLEAVNDTMSNDANILDLVHFDAHPDNGEFDDSDDPDFDHSNWVSYALRDDVYDTGRPLVNEVLWLGYRVPGEPLTSKHKKYSSYGFTQRIGTPLVVDIDLDVIDPAYAPGVGVPEAAGMQPGFVGDRLHRLLSTEDVRAVCITEYLPSFDNRHMTAGVIDHLIMDTVAGVAVKMSA